MILRTILLGVFFLSACGGDDSSDGGDADADTDTDSDTGGSDCSTNCEKEASRCSSDGVECNESCGAASGVDFAAWGECLDGLAPPCGDFDPNCCIAATGCRGF